MNRITATILALLASTLCHAAPDFDAIGVGDQNNLLIPGLLSISAPAQDWEWLVGEVVEHPNITVRPFYCQKTGTELAYQVLVYTLPDSALTDKKAFVEGLLDGALRGAQNQGFSVAKSEMTPSSVPSPGFTRFDYHLKSGSDSLYYMGFITVRKHAVSVQYSNSSLDSRDHFVSFAKGLQLETEPDVTDQTQPKKPAPSPESLSYRIGQITGFVIVAIIAIAIISKIRAKKKK